MGQPIIHMQDIGARYGTSAPVFSKLNLQVGEGDFYYLVGESGSGKTSLLRLLYLSLTPFQGTFSLLGEDLRGPAGGQKSGGQKFSGRKFGAQKARLRQEMGIVFQDFKLLDHLTVLENVAVSLRIRGLEGKRSLAQAQELLAWLGIEKTACVPSALSGGEKQRVAIARAIIARPRLLIADEPTNNIDDETAVKVFYLFEELHKIGTTVILATHSHDLVTAFPYPALRLEGERSTGRSPLCLPEKNRPWLLDPKG